MLLLQVSDLCIKYMIIIYQFLQWYSSLTVSRIKYFTFPNVWRIFVWNIMWHFYLQQQETSIVRTVPWKVVLGEFCWSVYCFQSKTDDYLIKFKILQIIWISGLSCVMCCFAILIRWHFVVPTLAFISVTALGLFWNIIIITLDT